MIVDNVKQLFAEIPSRFDPAKWGPKDAVLQFNVSGDNGGAWTASIAGGNLTVSQGNAAQPSMTMVCSDADLLAIVNGELNAVSAFMQGRVKIEGDMTLALKLQNLLSAEQE